MTVPHDDRSCLVPSHEGYNILPNYEFLATLLRNAHKGLLAVRDVVLGVEKSYETLLSDALTLKGVLIDALDKSALDAIKCGEEVFIGILAAGGYEYTVAFVALQALGAAAVPMTTAVPVEEALYYVQKSKQAAIISSDAAYDLASAIKRRMSQKFDSQIPILPVSTSITSSKYPSLPSSSILLSANPPLNLAGAALVIFTSGTTGPPKGAVLSRHFVISGAVDLIQHYDIKSSEVLLHVLPVHHATGTLINFLPLLVAGGTIEFRSGSFDPKWTWQRWREGNIAFFSGVPTIFMRLKRYHEDVIAGMNESERIGFEIGAREIRCMLCGTSALPRPLQQFWVHIRGSSTPILTRYGSTEIGAIFRMGLPPEEPTEGSVGTLIPGVEVELRDDDGRPSSEGEVLVRSPWMLSRYINDVDATRNSHDDRGYFQTGDIARREGRFYYILGRASQDIIKSGGYKISALDIERELLSLDFVSEATVFGVDDVEWGQRVAAIVSLRPTARTTKPDLSISNVRDALRGQLAAYKLPTLLRFVDGDLPKGPSGKVLKKALRAEMFPFPAWRNDTKVQMWNSRLGEAKL